MGYFRLIFELTSADISGKYPQIVSSEYFAKHNLKHKWTLRVPKMSINYKTPPILVLNLILIKFLYTLFGCYLVFYEGIKVSRTVFGQIGQCAVCYSWADLLEVTCKQQATGSSRAWPTPKDDLSRSVQYLHCVSFFDFCIRGVLGLCKFHYCNLSKHYRNIWLMHFVLANSFMVFSFVYFVINGNVNILQWATKGGKISDFFLWLHPPKNVPNHYPELLLFSWKSFWEDGFVLLKITNYIMNS